MKILYILILFVFLTSCKKSEKFNSVDENEKIFTMNQLSGSYDSITNRVMKYGDEDAYSELFYSFKDSNFGERTDSLMIYSKIMAEKYNDEKAYIDYLDAITEKYELKNEIGDYTTLNISKLDKSKKEKILSWLNVMLKKKIITQQEFEQVKK
ncbi:hypothetical protein Q73A0000_03870 [Kaistella flava (ex Peng et al. 2021)]|uniref:Uncharacterized protein n=1 Tax=Kaistella flava (ex Peng et al. 2021) TaxID=2038776 RepID=A0A7M2Y5X2_9FLAO|nr:hypothetical protein [Kaistella flava (ex Peng et al. 2021)]QOW09561.1 hypothetical protein Q73A0000_03870 [Kaistella flava (ex Peng et al. 2021)]